MIQASSIHSDAPRKSETHLSMSTKQLRVLHVLGQLSRGGVEVWLLNVLRNLDRDAYQFDFAVHNEQPGSLDAEFRELGSRVLIVDAPKKSPLTYRRQLASLIRNNGPFDIVHSHVHFFSGITLGVAADCGVPIRMAHSHVDGRPQEREANIFRKAYYWFMRRRIYRYAKSGLACCTTSAASLYGENWAADRRWQILPYGLEFSRFAHAPDRQKYCQNLGIPPQRLVVGQVGRLATQKNHPFAIQVVRELIDRGLDIHYVPVGGGPLEGSIRNWSKRD